MTPPPDFLILGQGLLGSLLALELEALGATVLIADRQPRRCSTLVSTGMIDPISGQRFALSWRYEETLQDALSTYDHIATTYVGDTIVTQRPFYRLFRDSEDIAQYEKKYLNGLLTPYIETRFKTSPFRDIAAPYGGIQIRGGYQVNVGALVTQLNRHFTAKGQFIPNPDTSVVDAQTVQAVIHCTGAYAQLNPLFSWLPFRLSRGEVLVLDCPTLSVDGIVNNGHWLAPGFENDFRFGATYDWVNMFGGPTQANYIALKRVLDQLIAPNSYAIRRVESGTRSSLADTRPVVGPHPTNNRHWVASGLGSKGTQTAPFIAANLAKSLTRNTPIDPDISISRLYKHYVK